MERRLKERLVGAGILVVLIVLVVPELLSGPKQTKSGASIPAEPTRTVTVDLDTQKTMALETPPDAPAAANPPPPPDAVPAPPPQAAAAPPEAAGAQPMQTAPTQTAPVRALPPQPAAVTAAAVENQSPSPKSWALQLGSFASRGNAEQLVRAVKAHNSPAYISTSGVGQSARYRVRVGPLADRAAAERMRVRLKNEGHPASVVAP